MKRGVWGAKRGVWGRKGLFGGVKGCFEGVTISCFFSTFLCYLGVNKKLNNMLHYHIITRLW